MSKRIAAALSLAALGIFSATVAFSGDTPKMSAGSVNLKSAGAIAFTPDGTLLVGDSTAAQVVAIDVNDRKAAKSGGNIDITGVNEKAAALLGTTPDQIMIQDVAVNPVSKHIYVSVSRGKGPDAAAVILRADASGKLSMVSLDNVKHSSVSIPDALGPEVVDGRGQSQRVDTFTSLAYVNGNIVVAGVSNEEFNSTLHSIPYPFKDADKGVGIKIWHSSHKRFETQAPIRTFVPYSIDNKEYILAAYTCTPLVKIPVADLQAGAKVDGTTIGNLGEGNRPLDMIAYQKDGHNYFLVANSKWGVQKLTADNLGALQPITTPTDGPAGVHIDTISELKDVQHLSKLDDSDALLLVANGPNTELRSIALP